MLLVLFKKNDDYYYDWYCSAHIIINNERGQRVFRSSAVTYKCMRQQVYLDLFYRQTYNPCSNAWCCLRKQQQWIAWFNLKWISTTTSLTMMFKKNRERERITQRRANNTPSISYMAGFDSVYGNFILSTTTVIRCMWWSLFLVEFRLVELINFRLDRGGKNTQRTTKVNRIDCKPSISKPSLKSLFR